MSVITLTYQFLQVKGRFHLSFSSLMFSQSFSFLLA